MKMSMRPSSILTGNATVRHRSQWLIMLNVLRGKSIRLATAASWDVAISYGS
jgi:hypothetical protein